jgi:hypothetical protein
MSRAPDPEALRRDRPSDPAWTQLVLRAADAPVPEWPLTAPSDRELELWRREWQRPQANDGSSTTRSRALHCSSACSPRRKSQRAGHHPQVPPRVRPRTRHLGQRCGDPALEDAGRRSSRLGDPSAFCPAASPAVERPRPRQARYPPEQADNDKPPF